MSRTKEIIKNVLFIVALLFIGSLFYNLIEDQLRDIQREKRLQALESTASPNVHILKDTILVDYLNKPRSLSVYLPPNYKGDTVRYPVIYFYDGQSLFDEKVKGGTEWKIDEVLDSLYQTDGLSAIVVGIYNSRIRLTEYKPFVSPKLRREKIVSGDKHAEWVATDLKAWIDQHYRTRPEVSHTFVGGASLGGLMAWYSISTYPDVYGGGFIYSPSLWVHDKVFDLHQNIQGLPNKLIYMNAGELETPVVKDVEKLANILKNRGMTSENLFFEIIPGEGHWHMTWQKGSQKAIPWLLQSLFN